jgi:anti-anti-sigma factor
MDDEETEVQVRLSDHNLAEVLVRGALDMSTRDRIDVAVSKAIDRGARRVLFDLRGVDHLDSTVIASFVQTRDRLGRGDVVAVVCHDDKKRIFHTVRLSEVLNVRNTREDAIAALEAA